MSDWNRTIQGMFADTTPDKPTREALIERLLTVAESILDRGFLARPDNDALREAITALRTPAEETEAVANIVPEGCTGSSLALSEGVLHVNKDGSGYILVKEEHFEIETEYDSEDGSRSDFWITRLQPSETQALRDFLNGVPLTTTTPPVDEAKVRVTDLQTYYERQIDWSRQTFGPALRTKGVIDHIRKELAEIEADPHDLSEWVDVVILAMDGFWRHGGTAEALMPALLAKQEKNMARTWPDWRKMSEDRAIEHDRSGEVALSPAPAVDEKGEGR